MLAPKGSSLAPVGLLVNVGNEGFESRRDEKKKSRINVPCLLSAGSPWPRPSRYPPRSQGCTAFNTLGCRAAPPVTTTRAPDREAGNLKGAAAKPGVRRLLPAVPTRGSAELPGPLNSAHRRHSLGSELYPAECVRSEAARSDGRSASTAAGIGRPSSDSRTRPDLAALTFARTDFDDWRSRPAGGPK